MTRITALLLTLITLTWSVAHAQPDRIAQAQQGITAVEIVGTAPAEKSVIQEVGWMRMYQTDLAGNLVWSGLARNALANEGEQSVLDTYFRGATPPAGFYLRLYNTTPALGSTLSTLSASEPATANGYNPANQGLARNSTDWPSLSLVSSHYEVTSKTITVTASGGTIGPVTYAAIATSSDNTGKLVSYAALSATRTLNAGDSLQMTSYKVRLQ